MARPTTRPSGRGNRGRHRRDRRCSRPRCDRPRRRIAHCLGRQTFEERWRSTATAPIRRLAISTDGSTLAALTAAGEVIIFDATSGDRHLLDVPTTNPTDIAVAADGSRVAIVDATTATTSIVEVRTGETVELAVPGGAYTRFVAADRLASVPRPARSSSP